MLEAVDSVIADLVCPRSHAPLLRKDALSLSTVDDSGSYPICNGVPVVVDFESSILDEETTLATAGRSVVGRRRNGGMREWLRRLVAGSPEITKKNVASLIDAVSHADCPRVLVIGGGSVGAGLDALYDHEGIRVVAFDIYASPNVQVIADAHKIPFADGTFDAVVIQAVLEHVLEPGQVVGEIHRVLSSDGVVYAETPFMQEVHEGPYDFTRFTDSGHRYLFRAFTCETSGALQGPADHLLRSVDYFFRSLFRSASVGKSAKLLFFWLRFFDRLIPHEYHVDAGSAVYFLGRKSNDVKPQGDMASYYQGAQ